MTRKLLLSLTACLTIGLLAQATRADEALPTDPRIKTGTLPNGVRWLWLEHANPPGKAAVWIHVRTGSLNEQENERGLSHFLEHMAFNGTEHYPGNALDEYGETIGMSFAQDVNAYTTFDRTAYMLYLPSAADDMIDFGLKALSDFAFRMLLTPEEVEKERGVILAEIRDSKEPTRRMQKKLFDEVLADSRVGQRWVLGTEEVISTAPPERFAKYYRQWYRPENVTLIVVADAAPEPHLARIEKWFGEYQAAAPAAPQNDGGLKPFATDRAFVFTDPDWSSGDFLLFAFFPGRPPSTTVAQARLDVVDELGHWIMNRRLQDLVKKGAATFFEAGTSAQRFFGSLLAIGSITGKPEDWEKMLAQYVAELDRAGEHGFLPQELELARKDLLAQAERDVETESTRDARQIVNQLVQCVNEREPILSAQQRLDLLKSVLPTIKLEEVNAEFTQHFSQAKFAYILRAPEQPDVTVPTTDAVVAAARAGWARTSEPLAWEERATDLIEHAPQPGRVVESTLDNDLGVTSAWLSNGVRVLHRYMDYKKDTVLVSVTFAGGELEETADNAGVTTAAALIFNQPATRRLSSSAIEDLMTGKKVRVRGESSGDTFSFTINGSPAELELGFQLVYALITDGVIEQSAFDTWKDAALQEYAQASKTPMFIAAQTMLDVRNAGDPRTPFMTPDKVERQSVAAAQAWLERICKQAPIDVVVVGDVQWADVQGLIEKYVGSLSSRPRTAEYLDQLRKLPRQPGPYTKEVTAETTTPQAVSMYGFMSTTIDHVRDARALSLASLALRSKLLKRVREELGLVYSIGAQSQPSAMFVDSGIFMAGAPCDADKGATVADEVANAFRAFADTGPTAEEFENAKKQIDNQLETSLKEPDYWMQNLRGLELHKKSLADLKGIREAYQALTVDDVRDVFKKYYTPARTFRVIVTPKATVAENAPAEAAGASGT